MYSNIIYRSRLSFFAGISLFLFLSVPLVAAQQPSGLTGSWQSKDTPTQINVTLNPDGTGKFDETPIRYSVRGDKLIVNEEGTINTYTFKLTGDVLVVSGGDLDSPLTFARQGSGRGLGGRRSQPAAGQNAETEKKEKGLAGRWRSPEATVQINEDGTLVLNGESYRYAVKQNIMTIANNEGSMQFPFQLAGDTLRVQVEGRTVIYKRVDQTGEGGVGSGSASGMNPANLFGKWCYMSNVNASNGGRMSNRCFTLYENGTYDYYSETSSSGQYGGTASQESDSGTWSVSGATLMAQSRAQGRLTFSLEKRNHPKTGDPMLVLDGDAFVTYSPRSPWP